MLVSSASSEAFSRLPASLYVVRGRRVVSAGPAPLESVLLLVLDSVTSTPQWIRQPKPRDSQPRDSHRHARTCMRIMLSLILCRTRMTRLGTRLLLAREQGGRKRAREREREIAPAWLCL
jgi:hypothetical protein